MFVFCLCVYCNKLYLFQATCLITSTTTAPNAIKQLLPKSRSGPNLKNCDYWLSIPRIFNFKRR